MAAALLSLFLLFASGVNSLSQPTQSRETTIHCGYQACSTPEKNKINVHLVPQTYDFEWNKAGFPSFEITVPNILSSVVEALLRNANRRFVFANTAFFWKWWSLQNAASRKQMRKLVQQGRLEFIGGGWSTNDEAVTHYQAIIDQMTWGLRLLNDTFGECGRPRVGWQIDPFGHSREMASIFAQMGYDGLFLGHVHYNDKRQRLNQKEMEMVWRGSSSLGPAADLFTHILYTETDEPHDFYMDFLCSNFTVNDDDKYSSFYRIKQKVNNLLETINHQSRHYHTNNIFIGIRMSSNFRYEDAETWYSNLEQVIRYVNANQDIGKKFNILYSTPNCYLKAVKDVNFIWTTFKNDFFPYASNGHNFWSGYYTSCPTRKYQTHIANNFLQVS
ncbi:hypothetical protein R5R35_011513 [Gryllus longicercus]|uniref:Glycoside hydrolase family 38 N-terminal domain-containing protein n=1 Tax=Gryllus longicercus TaxID=2509291 RepID=A0AAN9V160_9ORTH